MKQLFLDKGKRKEAAIYAFSFLIPSLMMICILDSIGIGYRGKLTLLTFDMREQYMPFIMSLRYVLREPEKLLFNWNNCLGGNYMGVFAYYMASPLNLVTLLWNIKDAPDAIYVLYLLKVGLSGLTFNVFLNRKHNGQEAGYSSLLFSTGYALMSYMIADGISIMWLDAVLLLPLVLLGVRYICDGKKGGLFLTSMALVFFSNFYMSYMVGIFASLYFCMLLFVRQREDLKYYKACVLRFGLNTLLAFGLALPVVLPALMNAKYSRMGRMSDNVVEIQVELNIKDLLLRFLPCQYGDKSLYISNGRPFIFCGSIFLVSALAFFLQKRGKKEKLAVFLMGVAVLSGFIFPKMDYVWHGFRYPAGFPYRYAYLFSCWMLMTGYEVWTWFRMKFSRLIIVLAVFYTISEIYINDAFLLSGIYRDYSYKERKTWDLACDVYGTLMQEMGEEQGFYRKRDMEHYICANVDSIYGTKGTGFFSSMYYNRLRMFLNSMGTEKEPTGVLVSMTGCSPVLDSILGVKYLIGEDDPFGLYAEKRDVYGIKLYENPEALCLGSLIPQAALRQEPEFTGDVFQNQDMLLEYLGLQDSSVYHKVDYEAMTERLDEQNVGIMIRFIQPSDKELCFYLDCERIPQEDAVVSYYVDDELVTTAGQIGTERSFCRPGLSEGEEHTIKIVGGLAAINNFYLYEFDREAFREEISELKEKQIQLLSCEGNRIKGCIDSDEGGLMFMTLPYDEGYTVYIDGEKVATQEALETFLSFPVSGGKHDIEIVFVPEGLKAGCAAMIFSVILIVIYYNVCKKKDCQSGPQKKAENKSESEH